MAEKRTEADLDATIIDDFIGSYITAALWSSSDEDGEPLDNSEAQLSPGTREAMEADCRAFLAAQQATLWEVEGPIRGSNVWEAAGHDFWLTRNHHGAGFWDGDWPEPQAAILTEAAHDFGEFDLYVGDNGDIDHG
jgi:hypothetical protein